MSFANNFISPLQKVHSHNYGEKKEFLTYYRLYSLLNPCILQNFGAQFTYLPLFRSVPFTMQSITQRRTS